MLGLGKSAKEAPGTVPARQIHGFVPREARARVDLPVVITPASGGEVAARLRNVSLAGFFAECEGTLEIGSTIFVASSELGEVAAQVRWAVAHRIGAVFQTRLSDAAEALIAGLLADGAEACAEA